MAKNEVPSKNSAKDARKMEASEKFEEPSLIESVLVIVGYFLLLLRGHLMELCWKLGFRRVASADEPKSTRNFVPLLHTFESFYKRQVYRPHRDCYNRPVYSLAGAEIDVLHRETDDYCWSFRPDGRVRRVINMGSYNYLGFAESAGPRADAAECSIRAEGIASCTSRQELGVIESTRNLERLVARFLGQQDAIVFQMGFATNSLNLPTLIDKHCCVLSDELAHASLVLGVRLSGATIRVFRHNDMAHLERCLQDAIVTGHPRTRRPYKKLIIVCEGIYSMEGSMVNLPAIINLKKRYKAYLYLDEAHSIGAIGPHARGVVDYFGCSFSDVDVLMGTFTKSFGASGGYISGSSRLISYLRSRSHSVVYGAAMSPPILAQITAAMRSLFDESPGRTGPTREGQKRIERLAWNTRYVRRRLHEARLIIYGHCDSPVIPVMLFSVPRIACFSRLLLDRDIAMVIAAWPATRVLLARARLCISAAHTKPMLDRAIDEIIEAARRVNAPRSRLNNTVPTEYDSDFYAAHLSHTVTAAATIEPAPARVSNGNGRCESNGSLRQPNRAEANGHVVTC